MKQRVSPSFATASISPPWLTTLRARIWSPCPSSQRTAASSPAFPRALACGCSRKLSPLNPPLLPLPAGPLRRILEHDAAGGELAAETVRGREVAVLAGVVALLDQPLDLGRVVLLSPRLRPVGGVEHAQHLVDVLQGVEDALTVAGADPLLLDRHVHLLDVGEQDGEGDGEVEVVGEAGREVLAQPLAGFGEARVGIPLLLGVPETEAHLVHPAQRSGGPVQRLEGEVEL